MLTAFPLMIGGLWLASLGGSLHYIVASFFLVGSALLLHRRPLTSAWTYAVFVLGTVIWSLWEVGLEPWELMPRLFLPLLLGILLGLCLFVVPSRSSLQRTQLKVAYATVGTYAVLLAAISAYPFHSPHLNSAESKLTILNDTFSASSDTEWRHYGRTAEGTRFSPATQISPDNVRGIEVVWTYRMGDPQHQFGEHQVTPLQVGSSLYLCTDRNVVIALDAESGRERWRFDPKTKPTTYNRCRGVAYYERPEGSTDSRAACRSRVLTSTIDVRLIAVDAQTGQPCADFGVHGEVDLRAGMGEVKHEYYIQTSAPTIARDLVILGGLVHDRTGADMPSGVVRAFSAETGALVWAWDPGNPAITREPPPGETYTRGTPNMWSIPSYDEDLGLLYLPMGAPTGATDFWGGWRTPAIEQYANSVVALDIATGRPRWHFQAIHHDLWDYDLPPQPTLFAMPDGKGGRIPALIQGSKHGQIFVLDRRDGKPITPVVEKPVPQGGQADDWTSPTQPFSIGMPSIGTEPLTEARMWGLTPFDQLWCRIQFRKLRYEGTFTPATTERAALVYPGPFGGMNWGGLALDPTRSLAIINDIRMPLQMQLISREAYNREIEKKLASPFAGHWLDVPLAPGVRYGQTADLFFSPLGIPCNAPPWGTLTAIDLNTRKIAWQVPLGTTRDTGPKGIQSGLPLPLGMPSLGGPIITQSGLIFFAGTQDFYLRAFDVQDGNELWKGRLPVGAQATPMTYISPESGRQFVVIVAGGAPWSKEKGDYVVAYALPQRPKS